jgi:2-polyprenyl-3-methyl-5-hydroxy-6-metoxy-1,4-benzoquinol methylase
MFKERSLQKELLDEPSIPDRDLFINLDELHTINSLLGGYAVTLKGLKKIISQKTKTVIADIGSGGADTLMTIASWGKKNNLQLELYGIDLKEQCVSYSRKKAAGYANLQFICDDFRNLKKHIPHADILHASLFCHHLLREEIIDLIRFAINNKMILVVNDLERNPFAYYSIKFLTAIFSNSYLVKNDAPLSVLRGFRKKEWLEMMKAAGATRFSVTNRWAFRHLIIVHG